jgi:rod shape-determining protein MreB
MKDGVIADFKVTEKMLKYFIEKAHNRKMLVHPRIVIGVPSEITPVEKRAVMDSAYRAHASEVHLVEQAMVAAIGAGLPVTEPSGNMIVDIGGGTTDVAVLSMQGVVTYETLRTAGDEMTQAIITYVKEQCGMLVGEQTAEKVKIAIGSAVPLELLGGEEMQMEVRGRDMNTSLPARILINSVQVREALQPVIKMVAASIKRTLIATPPEIAADLVDQGIMLAGGGASLRGLDYYLEHDINLPVRKAEEPIYAVVRGAEAVLQDLDKYTDILESADDL